MRVNGRNFRGFRRDLPETRDRRFVVRDGGCDDPHECRLHHAVRVEVQQRR